MTDSAQQECFVPALSEVLQSVPDFRKCRGKRYRLESVLALAIAATLCGYDSYSAMAEWGKNYGVELAASLGFKDGVTPSVGTLHTVFAKIDKAALQAALDSWTEKVLLALAPALAPGQDQDDKGDRGKNRLLAVSVDGKTLRGTRTQQVHAGGTPVVESHLLAAVSHGLGLRLGQQAVSCKENEIVAMKSLLSDLVLKGRVLTMDALLTQKDIARQIVLKGGSS